MPLAAIAQQVPDHHRRPLRVEAEVGGQAASGLRDPLVLIRMNTTLGDRHAEKREARVTQIGPRSRSASATVRLVHTGPT